jgi:hypothetical protein
MKKKLGMTLAMILLTAAVGARSSALSPAASPARRANLLSLGCQPQAAGGSPSHRRTLSPFPPFRRTL